MDDRVCVIGTGAPTRALREDVLLAAHADVNMLISGENGVGTTELARLIHRRSRRRAARFLIVDCEPISDASLEADLFGIARTIAGQTAVTRGRLERAHDGTLLLHDIGELSLRMQDRVMRFLATGEVHPVGSDRPARIADVRVIASASDHLVEHAAAGRFREALYYRLNTIHLRVPSLRQRREEIPDLVHHFMRLHAAAGQRDVPHIAPEAMERLLGYDWPGNVRELRNAIEWAMQRGRSVIRPEDLPGAIAPIDDSHAASSVDRPADDRVPANATSGRTR